MTLLILILWTLPGLILVTVPMLVLYPLTLLGLTWWRPGGDQTGPAVLVAGAIGVALHIVLLWPIDLGTIRTIILLVGLTALVWVPLGNLIWRGLVRLCRCRA